MLLFPLLVTSLWLLYFFPIVVTRLGFDFALHSLATWFPFSFLLFLLRLVSIIVFANPWLLFDRCGALAPRSAGMLERGLLIVRRVRAAERRALELLR